MKINVTRRDILKVGAGGAVGVMLTPAPWKMVDDLAIWTQNWSWIPRPPTGPSTMHATVCALCPAGCAVQARCIGSLPVSLRAATVAAPLCPLGLTGHHLPYHPARVARSLRVIHRGSAARRIPVPLDTVLSVTSSAIAEARRTSRSVAVLDMRPGRSVSWAWQRLLGSIPNGIVVPAPGREGANLATLQEMIGSGDGIGLDFDAARTILSFRAALAEGWGSERIVDRLRGGSVRLIQIDPIQSRTAAIAQRWLAARPGSEAELACGIANVLMSEKAVPFAASYKDFTPEAVAKTTGVPADLIVATARELAQNRPSLVVAGEGLGRPAEEAIHGLNLILGNGGIVPRTELPPPYDDEALAPVRELDRLADGSISVLIIDASAGDVRVPWPVVRRKLHADALIVALSPFFAGTAQRADYFVPVLPYLETVHELPTPFDAPAARLSIAAPLLQPRNDAIDPAAFIRDLARASRLDLPGDWKKSEDLMRARVAAIHAKREGSVTAIADGSTKATGDFGSPAEMWDAMIAGAAWHGVRASSSLMRSHPRPALPRLASEDVQRTPLLAVARIPRDVTASAAVSPVMTKLYQESGLRRSPQTVVVNPATATQLRLASGMNARLVTDAGSARVVIATDHAVMPGVVEVTAAPDAVARGETSSGEANVLDVLWPDTNGSWQSVAARLVEA
jgi:anaerobic selenocysteine-containing dehydrogenase